MTLDVDIRHRLGDFELDVRFGSSEHLTALFGASGSGKSSVVHLIAGLLRPSHGRIVVDGRVLVDTDAGIFLAKHKRRIGYVFQEPRLFPHLNVRHNLTYGRWFSPPADRYADLNRVVELLGIGPLLDRKPNLLSGGEKQRIAIGRALLASPKLLLMDEPLASLDHARKAEIMPYIERLRDETRIPIVYVSHSIAEVSRLARAIVVMSNGKVAASGTAQDILQRLDLLPAEERGEAGSVLDMTIVSHDEKYDMTVLRSPAGEIRIPGQLAEIGRTVRLRLRARDVLIATQEPQGLSALNILAGRIASLNIDGPLVDVRIDCGGSAIMSRITRQSLARLKLVIGMKVFAVVKTVSLDAGSISRTLAE